MENKTNKIRSLTNQAERENKEWNHVKKKYLINLNNESAEYVFASVDFLIRAAGFQASITSDKYLLFFGEAENKRDILKVRFPVELCRYGPIGFGLLGI